MFFGSVWEMHAGALLVAAFSLLMAQNSLMEWGDALFPTSWRGVFPMAGGEAWWYGLKSVFWVFFFWLSVLYVFFFWNGWENFFWFAVFHLLLVAATMWGAYWQFREWRRQALLRVKARRTEQTA